MRTSAIVIGIVLSAVGALAGEAPVAAFTQAPSAKRIGDKTVISFAVSIETDVAVYVLDAKGQVVRHLVAGMLGKNAPEPLKPNSLKQNIIWDGKDDNGQPVVGAVKVRVAIGMKPSFESFMLHNPDGSPAISNVAAGPKGNIYCFYKDPTANGNQGGLKIAIRDRDGRHVRQIMPFPADIPYERVKAAECFRDKDGRLVPQLRNWHTLNFYPDTQIARRRSTSTMSLPVVDSKGRLYWILGNRLVALDPDGGIPYDSFLGEPVTAGIKGAGMALPSLAVGKDDKYLYLSGLGSGRKRQGKIYVYQGYPAVLRIDVATRKATVFAGAGAQHAVPLQRPRGVDVAGGLLYVADAGAGRVAVFKEKDGSFVGEVKVKAPHTVDVDPKTGAIYTCVYTGAQTADLVKLSGYKNGKVLYRIALPKTGLSPNAGTHRIAGDFTGRRPRLWLPALSYARGDARWLSAYEDDGKKFVKAKLKRRPGAWANGPRDLLVDRHRDELYIKAGGENWYRFNEKTGVRAGSIKFRPSTGGPYMSCHGANLGVDSKGNLITHSWGKGRGLMRWTRDGKKLNWDGQKVNNTPWGGMMTFQLNYMTLFRDQIYVIKPQAPYRLQVLDMGLNEKRTVLWNLTRGSIPRLDAKGNIYLATRIKPPDRDVPEFFDGKLGKVPDYFRNIGEGRYWYCYMYGSIVKFKPEGGAFVWSKQKPAALKGIPEAILEKPAKKFRDFVSGRFPHRTGQVHGAEWVRFGFCPYSETYPAGTPVCMCEGAGFDVDPFGRVFYPNLGRFRVEVVDTNNNPITTFGHYGNRDSGSTRLNDKGEEEVIVKTPEIPLAWPTYVAVSDTHAYVNDTIGMRVVKVKLGYAAEQTCEVK
jgi:NHL repeat-containing protein